MAHAHTPVETAKAGEIGEDRGLQQCLRFRVRMSVLLPEAPGRLSGFPAEFRELPDDNHDESILS